MLPALPSSPCSCCTWLVFSVGYMSRDNVNSPSGLLARAVQPHVSCECCPSVAGKLCGKLKVRDLFLRTSVCAHVQGEPVLHRVHCSLNINTETGRLSARRPNLQNQPALEKDRYKVIPHLPPTDRGCS